MTTIAAKTNDPSSDAGRLNCVDGLRAIAVLAVVAGHVFVGAATAAGHLARFPYNCGARGVDLFFASTKRVVRLTTSRRNEAYLSASIGIVARPDAQPALRVIHTYTTPPETIIASPDLHPSARLEIAMTDPIN